MSIIGIDFGTCLNKVGWYNEFGLKIVSNNSQNPSTPSVIYVLHEDKFFFGEKAVKQGMNKKSQLISEAKVMLGRKYDDPFIQKRKEKWPFKIEEKENSININIAVDKKQKIYYPYQIAGLIFKNLIEVSNLKSEVNKSKIIFSIPSLSNRETINEIIKAADSVDLHVSCFITEPILALFAYLYSTKVDFSKGKNVILMYSLGASFLEVSLIEIDNGHFQITTKRDDEVYGQQFDDNVFEYVESEMIKKNSEKKDFLKQKKIQAKLHQSVEDAKIYLSEHDTADIIIEDESLEEDDDNKENSLKFTLTIEKFNEINQLIFEKSTKLVESMISEIKEQINHLFLVGGSTYIKRIRELLNEKTGKEATQSVDPREAVALGSCIAGAYIFHLNMEKFGNINSKLIADIISQLKVTWKFNFLIFLIEDSCQTVFVKEEEFQEKTVCLKTKCKNVIIFIENKNGEKNFISNITLENPVIGNISVSLKIVLKNSDFWIDGKIGSNQISFPLTNEKISCIYGLVLEESQRELIQSSLLKSQKKSSLEEKFANLEKIQKVSPNAIYDVYKVAEKVTKKIDKDDLKSFLKKSKTLNMHHPNILKIYEIFDGNETTPPSILLEYCPKTLFELIKERKRSTTDIIFILYQIAEGIRYAHSLNIIHGGMNPYNIMVSDDGTIKISDFSISMLAIGEQEMKGFVAPEIIEGNKKYNEKVDVYSFGSIMYFVLTGSIPNIQYKDSIQGKKINLPKNLTKCACDMIYSCWNIDAEERPCFESIVEDLEKNGSNFVTKTESQSLQSKIKQHKSKILSTKKHQ